MEAAVSESSLLGVLRRRYATKKYDPLRKIPEATWKTLEEAIVLAPSSHGLQPWKAVVVDDRAVRFKLRGVAHSQTAVTDASHLVVFAIKKNLSEAHIEEYLARAAEIRKIPLERLTGFRNMIVRDFVRGPKSLSINAWAQRQAYIGLAFLLFSAALLGLDATPMEGFEPDKFDDLLGLSEQGLAATVMCAVGYRATGDAHAADAKVRMPVDKVIFHV